MLTNPNAARSFAGSQINFIRTFFGTEFTLLRDIFANSSQFVRKFAKKP